MLVACNSAALQHPYATDLAIAAQYGGDANDLKLSNDGESIRLTNVLGREIQALRYNDGWYPQTDGQGPSLQAVLESDPLFGSEQSSWRPSIRPGGTP